MSDKPAVIQGCYVDLKFMPGIKCARVAIDIPIEHSNAFLKMFDAPDRANPVAVAIARLSPASAEQPSSGLSRASNTEPDSPPPVGPSEVAGEGQDTRRTFRNMPRSQQAALKCRDLEFQKWLRDTNPKAYTHVDPDWNEAKCCDHALKLSLVISSKKDLDELPCAAEDWDKIIATFDNRHHIR